MKLYHATVPETTTTTPPVTEPITAITTTQPIPTEIVITTPKNGTIEGDLIWVQGFGWIEYEGGGGIGYYNAEMYGSAFIQGKGEEGMEEKSAVAFDKLL